VQWKFQGVTILPRKCEEAKANFFIQLKNHKPSSHTLLFTIDIEGHSSQNHKPSSHTLLFTINIKAGHSSQK